MDLETLGSLRSLLLDACVRSRQSRRADSATICTTKLFFSAVGGTVAVAGVVDPGPCPPTDAIAARNSDSRLDGRSARMLRRPPSARPVVAEPANQETTETTGSATAPSFPGMAGTVLALI